MCFLFFLYYLKISWRIQNCVINLLLESIKYSFAKGTSLHIFYYSSAIVIMKELYFKPQGERLSCFQHP